MNDLKLVECGSYLPSFFYLKVNTHENLEDLNVISKDSFATFTHEYIHFLQDLFTSFGLHNIIFNVNIIKEITKLIHESAEATFPIPYVLPPDDLFLTYKDLFSLFYGDDETKRFDVIIEIKTEPNKLIKGYEDVKTVEVFTQDSSNGSKSSFYFGAICLMEYIAYVIEKNLFDSKNTPKFPYKVPELIAECIYPEFKFNDEVLLALAEKALDSQHPGPFFIDMLKRISSLRIKLVSFSDVQSFCAPYLFLEREAGKEVSLKDVYEMEFNAAEKSLKDYFTSEQFSEAAVWLTNLFETVRYLKPSFSFCNFIQANGKEEFIKVFEKLGSPIMSNLDEMQYLYIPYNDKSDMNVPLFKAISIVYEILHGFRKNCTLKEHCKRHKTKNIVNEHCDAQPWLKMSEDSLCPLMIIWRMWGLDQKTPILV